MKYHNKKTECLGIIFDSKKESVRYQELLILEKGGEIKNLERQVKFQIVPKNKDERSAFYVADFVYENKKGDKIIEDVKSAMTRKLPLYILKRKLVKYLYSEYLFIET